MTDETRTEGIETIIDVAEGKYVEASIKDNGRLTVRSSDNSSLRLVELAIETAKAGYEKAMRETPLGKHRIKVGIRTEGKLYSPPINNRIENYGCVEKLLAA